MPHRSALSSTSTPIATRLPAPLHAAVVEAAARAGTTPGGWLRETAAGRLGIALEPRPRAAPRRRHRPPSEHQSAARAAVAALGTLGAAVAETGTDDALVVEIRRAVAAVVAAVVPSR